MSLHIKKLTGDQLGDYLQAVARLRITVFAEFPYLYDGDLAYENWYLQKLAELTGAVIVAAFDDEEVIGAATGSPMVNQFEDFSAPLVSAGYDINEFFYCGESVLLPQYRGQGVGHEFFDYREDQARALGLKKSCFLSVIRADDDPRRPEGYRDLHGFWRKRGYEKMEGLTASFPWQEHGSNEERINHLCYWIRGL